MPPGAVETALDEHGAIGDLHSAALVGCDGAIDWCCLPRFDSPSVFAALLDRERGGLWQIAPSVPWTSEQRYLPGTTVLQTVFQAAEGGVVHVTDFMPVGPARAGRCRIFRCVRGVRGAVPVELRWAPRFDFARRAPHLFRLTHGVLASDRGGSVLGVSGPAGVHWEVAGDEARATFTPAEGETLWFVQTFDEDEVLPVADHEPDRIQEETTRWWDAWSSQLRYDGPYRKEVQRSALTLKLCCYEPTGAIVAAPTTSLPESLTGGRTWDYRFAWLRDAAFVLEALDALGCQAETGAFLHFLKRVARRAGPDHLQIMYAVDGAIELPERALDHLRGYRGIGPVRIGNGAAGQFQLDIYGEMLLTASAWLRERAPTEGLWRVLRDLVEWTAGHWRRPDYSIWEPRHEPRHHVFSKVMAWAALDHGARLAERSGHAAEAERWRAEAAAVHADVLERGWDPERGSFVQCYGEPQLDAALLVIPKVGFLPPDDARVRSTLEAVRRDLGTACEDLVYRYRSADGLAGDEGAFVICSFWMIQNLALTGRLDEAERLFRNLLRRANPVGLLAEEIDPATGEQMGNYPQCLSHAALINTAVLLERLRPAAGQPTTANPVGGPAARTPAA